MATHSSTLDRKIPWMEEPGRLQSTGPLRVRHGWATSLLEKEMATHPSVLAWRIPGMGEPGGLLSMGSHRVGHDWSDLAAAAAAAGGIYSVALSTLPYCFFFLLTTQRRLLAQLPLILVPISLLLGVGLRCNTCYLTIWHLDILSIFDGRNLGYSSCRKDSLIPAIPHSGSWVGLLMWEVPS